jgi:glutaredoxin
VRFTRLRDRRSAASGRRAGRSASETRVVLFGRPGCHLCDDARVVVERVTTELGERYEERDITLDPNDLQAYVESIPVVLVDGVQVDFWRVSEDRLRAALLR